MRWQSCPDCWRPRRKSGRNLPSCSTKERVAIPTARSGEMRETSQGDCSRPEKPCANDSGFLFPCRESQVGLSFVYDGRQSLGRKTGRWLDRHDIGLTEERITSLATRLLPEIGIRENIAVPQ